MKDEIPRNIARQLTNEGRMAVYAEYSQVAVQVVEKFGIVNKERYYASASLEDLKFILKNEGIFVIPAQKITTGNGKNKEPMLVSNLGINFLGMMKDKKPLVFNNKEDTKTITIKTGGYKDYKRRVVQYDIDVPDEPKNMDLDSDKPMNLGIFGYKNMELEDIIEHGNKYGKYLTQNEDNNMDKMDKYYLEKIRKRHINLIKQQTLKQIEEENERRKLIEQQHNDVMKEAQELQKINYLVKKNHRKIQVFLVK